MIGALILGLVAGFLARAVLPGRQSVNFLMTIVLGLAGAALGWLLFTKLIGIGDDDAFDLGGLPGATVGAVVLLWGYERFVASRESAPSRAPTRSRAERELGAAERGREREAGERPGGERPGGGQGRRGGRGGEGRGRRREP